MKELEQRQHYQHKEWPETELEEKTFPAQSLAHVPSKTPSMLLKTTMTTREKVHSLRFNQDHGERV